MTPIESAQHEWLTAETHRLVPALVKARLTHDQDGVENLYTGFIRDAWERDISAAQAWSVLATSSINWSMQLWTSLASEREIDVLDQMDESILATLEWLDAR